MAEDDGRMVRRRRVGMLLRQYRNAAGLTAQQVADELDCSVSKVTRIELARVPAQRRDVRDMLNMFGVTGEERQEIVDLLGDSKNPDWWHAYHEYLSRKYRDFIALEADAACLRTYEPQVVPGLLQTADYARAAIHKTLPEATPKDIDARVEVRLARQDLLTRPDPVRLVAVLDEGALRRQVGSTHIMQQQYKRLLDASAMPNVRLQVLDFSRPSACTTGPFILIEFPRRSDPWTVYLENAAGDQTLEKPARVDRYKLTFEELAADALGPADSTAFLERLIRDQR
ncbi:transcriptional regulator [Actinocatenispora thailandica]|uniref:Transcriptional regulator n=1 Tax=Actinocatenispora thailandica TaxID=227318 RepID=A0A7R7HVE1_9ACTN|nr:helix-turn-helix transcriptional regulator [Actinocatenispora thailandica]BCJ33471.1 transcriptional regulator [Actinocatenispora thailandica]